MSRVVKVAGAVKTIGVRQYGDEDAGADNGGDGVLPDDVTLADWLSELASTKHGTLLGRLWLAVFFLIFAARSENGGCRFITSGPNYIGPSCLSRDLNRHLN
jgi:hypothetical protein